MLSINHVCLAAVVGAVGTVVNRNEFSGRPRKGVGKSVGRAFFVLSTDLSMPFRGNGHLTN